MDTIVYNLYTKLNSSVDEYDLHEISHNYNNSKTNMRTI